MSEWITAAWPILGAAFLFVCSVAVLRSQHGDLKERVAKLEGKHETLESKIVDELAEVKVALAEIKGWLKGREQQENSNERG